MNKFKCQLFTAQSGALSARVEDENGFTIHIHSLVKPELESQYFDDITIWGDRVILLGTGLGYHLQKLKDKIPSHIKIIVIEYYEELAKICIREFFDKETVFITSDSPDPAVTLREFVNGGEYVQIIKHPVAYRIQRAFYDELVQTSLIYTKSWKKQGTILLMYGNFFVQEELRRAINVSCMKTELFDYRKSDSFIRYQNDLDNALQKCKPEMIFSVNMMGFDGNGIWSDLSSKYSIPVCVWFVDDPAPMLLHQQQYIRSNMTAFCWEKAYLDRLKNAGFSKVYYLPLATAPELFSRKASAGTIADLAFVGSAMNGEFLGSIRKKFLWNPSMEPIVNYCAEILSEDSNNDPANIILQACKEHGITLPFSDKRNLIWLQSLIVHTASMKKRKKVVETLLEYGIETFGDSSGWIDLCGNRLKTNRDIDYRTELADIYRGIRININITSCQMPSGVNQRVFDIPACGGFVINDQQSDLAELFEQNEIVTYSSPEELLQKVQYYKCNETERNQISDLAYKRIINEHTYINRIKTMYSNTKK